MQTMYEIQDKCGFRAGDGNLRRYVGNNPTNATDPSGLQAKPPPAPPPPPIGGFGGGNPSSKFVVSAGLLGVRTAFLSLPLPNSLPALPSGAFSFTISNYKFDDNKITLKQLQPVKNAMQEAKQLLALLNGLPGPPDVELLWLQEPTIGQTGVGFNISEIKGSVTNMPIMLPFPLDGSPVEMWISTTVTFKYSIKIRVAVTLPTTLVNVTTGVVNTVGNTLTQLYNTLPKK